MEARLHGHQRRSFVAVLIGKLATSSRNARFPKLACFVGRCPAAMSCAAARCPGNPASALKGVIQMNIELQVAAGLLTGLFAGLALGLLRPLLLLAVGGLAVYLAVIVAFDGPPAIGVLLDRVGRSLSAFPVFYSALAAAKAFGCVIALRR